MKYDESKPHTHRVRREPSARAGSFESIPLRFDSIYKIDAPATGPPNAPPARGSPYPPQYGCSRIAPELTVTIRSIASHFYLSSHDIATKNKSVALPLSRSDIHRRNIGPPWAKLRRHSSSGCSPPVPPSTHRPTRAAIRGSPNSEAIYMTRIWGHDRSQSRSRQGS